MGIWTSAFLCALCRLTWLPLACTARVIWIRTHHVSCTHSSESLTSPSLSLSLSLYYGGGGFTWGGGGVVSGCRVFCLFLGVWLPSLPCSGVAWSRLSSTLFIVYLPNEGGGTLWHVIDSNVLAPITPPQPPSSPPHTSPPLLPSSGQPGLWLSGWDVLWRRNRNFFLFFFFYIPLCFCGKFFFSFSFFLNPPLVGRPCWEDCGRVELWWIWIHTHSCLPIIWRWWLTWWLIRFSFYTRHSSSWFLRI